MTKRTRRNHSADFKAKVALAAMKGDRTIAQLSDQFGVHVSTAWKEQLQEGAANVFGLGTGTAAAAPPIDVKALRADSGPSRTVIPTHCGQHSGDCGQFLMSV